MKYKCVRQRLDHPFFPKGGYVREHRFVYEESRNCILLPLTEIHHLDGNRTNNVWYNLRPFFKSQHSKIEQLNNWLGRKHSEQTRRMMSIMRKGKPGNRLGAKQTFESRRKMSLGHKGKILSEEHKRKIGESVRKRYQ